MLARLKTLFQFRMKTLFHCHPPDMLSRAGFPWLTAAGGHGVLTNRCAEHCADINFHLCTRGNTDYIFIWNTTFVKQQHNVEYWSTKQVNLVLFSRIHLHQKKWQIVTKHGGRANCLGTPEVFFYGVGRLKGANCCGTWAPRAKWV